ncbi:hypothetical protein ERN12_02390 [Rhodobacteraceae bacterium]|nr:hypothetical protein ERN12_02390 [Paracoccaceae bacterium]
MITNSMILGCFLTAAVMMSLPFLRARPGWRAMVTPLASIIGSGFLVIGPILQVRFGWTAPFVMVALCLLAWGFGRAIRFNIHEIDHHGTGSPSLARLEQLASLALGLAYVISVAYYLNLFGAFAMSLTPWDVAIYNRLVTTGMFLAIGGVGIIGGFSALERIEYKTLTLNLSIIAGLLAGLVVYFITQSRSGAIYVLPPDVGWIDALRLAFGLIVTVQGFETARYMANDYDAATRIRAMRWAQLLSSAIYIGYICLLSYVFAPSEMTLSETAIIDIVAVVSPILPVMLVITALAAQFSAAVADTGGAGGLASELSHQRITPRRAYLGLVAAGITLTWTSDLFVIISYASRAFALYYAIQSLLAALRAPTPAGRVGYGALALIGVAIAAFGISAEG